MRACSRAHLGCEGELAENSDFDECSNCRSYAKRWKTRKPLERLRRYRSLKVWENRMEPFIPAEETHAPKRRFVAEAVPMRRRA